jgi:hypothetical protein
MNAMRGMQNSTVKQRVAVGEQIKIVLKGADKMDPQALMDATLKILDTVKDSGLSLSNTQSMAYYAYRNGDISPVGLVTFRLTDAESLRQQAYKTAIDMAKEKARKLADMAGIKLGPIVSIEEGGGGNTDQQNVVYYNGYPQSKSKDEFSSKAFGDITVSVRLTVRFDIAK